MNPQDTPGQMTVEDCIAMASVDEVLYLALTQHDPATMCSSPAGGCQSWASCEIAGRCLGAHDDE